MKSQIKIILIISAQIIILIALFMISGCERKDIFNNNKISFESLIEINTTPAVSHQTGVMVFSGSILSVGTSYLACEPLTVDLHDGMGASITAVEDITAGLDCNGGCGFFSDTGCTTLITNTTISLGTSTSPVFYVKPTSPNLSLKTLDVTPYYTGSSVSSIPVVATYSLIDAPYVWSAANLYTIGNNIDVATITAGDVWIFESRDGFRGKIKINSLSTTNVTGDTFNFDAMTWGPPPSYTLQSYSPNQTIVACFTGNCYMDLDMSPVVVSSSSNVDLWWENLSGSLYFNPQATAVFRLLP